MEQLTTYQVKGKKSAVVYVFKYDLNGNLKVFEIVGEPLNEQQKAWLFATYRFPIDELKMKYWQTNSPFKEHFVITKIAPDLSFEALWETYNYKMGKKDAIKMFNKLKEAEIIKVFLSLKGYEAHLKRTGQAKAYLATYLNKEYYNNEYRD
ncbi:hypothetical protein [Capnocytophaga catalasegens]|uniref:Uncharacterized protein n=1 Tax=Capnocytophaga catalasegens TaxID=1004260 RepID=A0AAV5AVD5_9FLAO|nr:hypothetical protein [Capnocytophaga catalasegens]GIZ15287.1 hypothetical protein RCZ03_12870 [Capnocytophaga catalasegens]GJM51221.1 hypothetical protein RCZ15_21940 [Capnocytophaga catalasegens]GJM53015.1 hypothetical protein RCZ16_13320 [Capnocytophaga catalasegens]